MGKMLLVKEWFDHGDKDLKDAEFLFKHNRELEIVAFHIQQAVEKYLKGFLIYKGKELERIHDLVKLLKDVTEIDSDFEQFMEMMRRISNYYFESRYPLGYDVDYTKEEIEENLIQTKRLIKLISERVKYKP